MRNCHFGIGLFWPMLLALELVFALLPRADALYVSEGGYVHFESDAPLEVIEASSNQLRGVIDADQYSFAFTIPMASFEGFNSPLQREHYNENYLESRTFPNATFSGRIIEKIDFGQAGRHSVRAKGKLTVHGVERERIIKSTLEIGEEELSLEAQFTILLEDHDIQIPRIVFQKIAEEIKVDLKAQFYLRK